MSLDSMQLWPFRYTIMCEPRQFLDENLGTLPDHTLYIGSSNNVSQRLCYHFQSPNHGSQYTRRHQPISVVGLCVKRTRDAKACLALEDELVLQTMFEYCCKYSHPEVWKCVAGGSWSKVDAKYMPRPLQFRLANMPPVENKKPQEVGRAQAKQ